jgi:malate synthase
MPTIPAGVTFTAPISPRHAEILTPEAIAFLVRLHRDHNPRRKELLAARITRQSAIDSGTRPDFLPDTAYIRNSDWTIAPLPPDLLDRRVEITGPVDRKMIINALNSGAKVFMADFEDSTTPTWDNLIDGQLNLRDAIRRTITYEDPTTKKSYKLNDQPAVLFVRARGWHLEERHMLVDGDPISGSLFDFGLHAFHNAHELLARNSGPYFYLPKIESHLEARLWNEVFLQATAELDLPPQSIKATVLIETILATFEMDEILYELRDHSAGLNCGRWDYIFSFIKKFAGDSSVILPDRAQITMATHFMRSYSRLCIKTCHRRNAPAMGGMSALIPIKSDPIANARAIAGVRADKEREATDGHDGTWVAHPGLVPIAFEVFNRIMPQPNQIDKQLPDYQTTAAELLQIPTGSITLAGLTQNVAVGLGYVEAWLRGIGCVPLFNLMEDAATAEISRAQLWQWVHHHAHITEGPSTGQPITIALVNQTIADELSTTRTKLASSLTPSTPPSDSTPPTAQSSAIPGPRLDAYDRAATLLRELIASPTFPAFLTVPAYTEVLTHETF